MYYKEFPYVLGSSNPWPNAVLMEPFSTSVFKVFFFNDTATTEIYTKDCSSQIHIQAFYTVFTPSYSSQLLFAVMVEYRYHA